MGKVKRALGLMSGTSMDGIDVALIETNGQDHVKRGAAMTFPYRDEIRALIGSAITDAAGLSHRDDRPGALPHAEREITELHAAAVNAFLRKQSVARDTIDVIGFHGQTVLHKPRQRLSVQLGIGDMLADLTRLPVVYDLRAADIAAGGEGAPLVPVYHRALASAMPQRPIAIVNIGGVANLTWIGRDGRLIAFDTGPGNALIDDWMARHNAGAFDDKGDVAATGKINVDILHDYLMHPYFSQPGPKSLDRNAFDVSAVDALTLADGAATLTALTAETIAKSRALLPEEPELWIIAGGGRLNHTLMRRLAGAVHSAVVPAEAVGLDGGALEAEAWAYLAVRSLANLPLTFPGTTGVASPLSGGLIARPKAPFGH
ncbi:MAG: anhydro-N-acetylmuramic acid kinase [Hyphomicrobium sp.]